MFEMHRGCLLDLTFHVDDRGLLLSEGEASLAWAGSFWTGCRDDGTGKRCGGILAATQVIYSSVFLSLLTRKVVLMGPFRFQPVFRLYMIVPERVFPA